MSNEKNRTFGSTPSLTRREEIKALLRSKGQTMSDIARSLDLKPATIQAVVSGRSYSKRVAEAIASELGLQVNDIWPERKQGRRNIDRE